MIQKKAYNIILSILTVIGILTSLTACEDQLNFRANEIEEGESLFQIEARFKDFTPALESRTAGNTIQAVSNLKIAIYDAKTGAPVKVSVNGGQKIFPLEFEGTQITGSVQEGTAGGYNVKINQKIKLPNGSYYMYAIANVSNKDKSGNDIDWEQRWATKEDLFATRMIWDTEDMNNNAQMFGAFDSNLTEGAENGRIDLNGGSNDLHVNLRRCASKVTVAYDGTNLNDGVAIYLMGVSIKDIPVSCALYNANDENTINHADSLIHEGELIKYFEGDVLPTESGFFDSYKAKLTKDNPTYGSDHSDTADAMFFYENMQGKGNDKRQDADGDGVLDHPGGPDDATYSNKDGKEFGTYIEVEAIYRVVNTETVNGVTTEKPESGIIKYRFMLGKDVTTDYNAERNHHYKLTLKFNGSAKDIDWHIDYTYPVLEASDPKIFDYRGKVFMANTSIPNGGHEFSVDNVVTVRSYMEDGDGSLEKYNIEYMDEGATSFTSSSSWLTLDETKTETGRFPYEQKLYFNVIKQRNDVVEFEIDNLLQAKGEKGTSDKPFNLANPAQTSIDPAQATIVNTANCYMVDGPGYYLLPLVYGNAIQGGAEIKKTYQSPASGGSNPLGNFKNHLGNNITSAYIRKNSGVNPVRATLIMQDEKDLLSYDLWSTEINETNKGKNVIYLPNAYKLTDGTYAGGIQFYVSKDNIKQGNAVIALVDRIMTDGVGGVLASPGQTDNSPVHVIWSWHIWVTDFSPIPQADETIKVTTGVENEIVDFMPVNLGWCSAPGDVIKYYPGRKCKVRFSSPTGKVDPVEITIEQKSHIAVTRGNTLYYQWGRKDPFMGSANEATTFDGSGNPSIPNKPRYFYPEAWAVTQANYDVLNGNQNSDDNRKTTRNALADLISYPYKWHNPPRKAPGYDNNPFQSINETYSDLWGGGSANSGVTVKTIYDPCPVGYKVPHFNAFTGFTTRHNNSTAEAEWYDAREYNIENYINRSPYWEDNETYYKELYEFYTDPTKTQSIIFPVTGYRDWDNGGYLFNFGIKGFTWTAIECVNANALSGGNYDNSNDWIFNFDFARPDMTTTAEGFIRPKDLFFSCDGFPVRPVRDM